MKKFKLITLNFFIFVILVSAILGAWLTTRVWINTHLSKNEFNGNEAFHFAEEQIKMGPRGYDGYAHLFIVDWLKFHLLLFGWKVDVQQGEIQGIPVENIIAHRSNLPPKVILAAHYDTRLYADKDPDPTLRNSPVPGADDGASGVAVLLELAKVLPETQNSTWLVFFDAEDNGGIDGRSWSMGSQYFVSSLKTLPEKVVIVDMVGDKVLNIYKERNSDLDLSSEIWSAAGQLGFQESFISTPKYSLIDDHLPFVKMGIHAVDIIDFDFPYWHTTHDTIDKISPQSLEIVGKTLYYWLANP